MSSLLNKTGDMIHKQQGFYVSDSWMDAPVGTWGTRDSHIFEGLGALKDVNQGVPDPVTHSISMKNMWFNDEGVSHGAWQVGAKDPSGIANVSVKITFDHDNSVSCFLSDYWEVFLDNNPTIGDKLAELYREPGKAWKTDRKWVYQGLKVKSGFVVMNEKSNTSVTVSGKGTVDAGGVPISFQVGTLQSSSTAASEFHALDNTTVFVKLCEVYDPPFSKASWHQIG